MSAGRYYAPGERKNNRFIVWRGHIGGTLVEVSTKTTDPLQAELVIAKMTVDLLSDIAVPAPAADITFAAAVKLYKAFVKPSKDQLRYLDKLAASPLGKMKVRVIAHPDLVKTANDLYAARAVKGKIVPEASNDTKNRQAMGPAAAVLHYCAENGYCPWMRVKLFKRKRAENRAVSFEVIKLLIANVPLATTADGRSVATMPAMFGSRPMNDKDRARFRRRQAKRRLLLVWLFLQGMRITNALQIRVEKIDMPARTVEYTAAKGNRAVTKPIQSEVLELLADDPDVKAGNGLLFPWRSRHGVYKWLRPYVRDLLKVRFTPHMARHTLGKGLNETGASLRTIMDALDHLDKASSVRYQSTDIEPLRHAVENLKRISGGDLS